MSEIIIILDFGSQYNQLIARRVRENRVFCRILPCDTPIEKIRALKPKGIILSGGPASVYQKNVPKCDKELFKLGVPVLGICYGMQFMVRTLGGRVTGGKQREYGRAELILDKPQGIFYKLPKRTVCWMSHCDSVQRLPSGFMRMARTKDISYAAIMDRKRKFYGVQFHPEVAHTEKGKNIIRNFIYRICGCPGEWTMKGFIEEAVEKIRKDVDGRKVVLGLSGGVDSSICAALIHKAIGKKLTCIFVDNGLIRKDEGKRVKSLFKKHFGINLVYADEEKRFLRRLKGVEDPEKKRKIIGGEFIKVFEQEAARIGKIDFLAQGTLYPDVIESVSAFGGPTAMIKSHHNVGGLPAKMRLKLIEPLRELFKDEVRAVGKQLGLPDEIVLRQPFPGPGLAVRILGEVTKARCEILREADFIVVEEMKDAGLYYRLWQTFAVLLPVKSVGVMGDERTYENVIVIRAVTSQDGMTADWAKIPYELLGKISNRIINEVRGVNRVAYDISSKPPSTIEWE